MTRHRLEEDAYLNLLAKKQSTGNANSSAAFDQLMVQLNKDCATSSDQPIWSNNRVFGKILVAFRRFMRRTVLNQYLSGIVNQQNAFNANVINALQLLQKAHNEYQMLWDMSNQDYQAIDILQRTAEQDRTIITELQQAAAKDRKALSELHNNAAQDRQTLSELQNTAAQDRQTLSELQSTTAQDRQTVTAFQGALEQLTKRCDTTFSAIPWTFVSAAQCGEDGILRYLLCAGFHLSMEQCTYLDLGANHAIQISNTFAFYNAGASGVLVEANPALAEELRCTRPRDTVLEVCIGEETGSQVPFYILNGDGLSTISKESAQAAIAENDALHIQETRMLPVMTVSDIVKQHCPEPPAFLSIDLEGIEETVLKQLNLNTYRPKAIVMEMIQYRKHVSLQQPNKAYIDLMAQYDYVPFAYTSINIIFVDKRALEEANR